MSVDVYMTVNGTPVNATVANPNGVPQPLTFSNTGAVTAPVGGGLNFNGFTPPDGAQPMNMSFQFRPDHAVRRQFGVTSITQNGYATGQLSTVAIDPSGIVSAVYTNGRSTQLGQLAMANFPNPQGLKQLGDTNWSETFTSGTWCRARPASAGIRQHSIGRAGKLQRGFDHAARQHDHRAARIPGQRAGHHDGQSRVPDRHPHHRTSP